MTKKINIILVFTAFLLSSCVLNNHFCSSNPNSTNSSSTTSFDSGSSSESFSYSNKDSSSSSSTSSSSSLSSSSSQNTSSSHTSSSVSSSNSSSTIYPENGYYRVEPITSNQPSFNVYNLDGTVHKTFKKSVENDQSTWYIDPMEVALYYQAYHETPVNYCYNVKNATSREHFSKYGKYARFYSKDYTRRDGYMAAIPSPNEYRYFEIDISNGKDGYSYSKRQVKRLVVVYSGLAQYSSTSPVIFLTLNHYKSFYEVTNYAKKSRSSSSLSWIGDEFDGEGSGYGTYKKPITVTI